MPGIILPIGRVYAACFCGIVRRCSVPFDTRERQPRLRGVRRLLRSVLSLLLALPRGVVNAVIAAVLLLPLPRLQRFCCCRRLHPHRWLPTSGDKFGAGLRGEDVRMFPFSLKYFDFSRCRRLSGVNGAPAQTTTSNDAQRIKPRREDVGR